MGLGILFFLMIGLLAMWVLAFLFTVIIPGSITLKLLERFAPKWVEKMSENW